MSLLTHNTSFSRPNHDGNNKIVRRIINSAVYVEKILPDMLQPEDFVSKPLLKPRKRVKCCCSSAPNACPCHPENNVLDASVSARSVISNSSTNTESQATTVRRNTEFKLSLTSLRSSRVDYLDTQEKEEILRSWLDKKTKEMKVKQVKEQKLLEEKQRQREELIEKERENFRRWLAEKKKYESKKIKQQEAKLLEEKRKEKEREKRQRENELSYKLWLQRKRQSDLEKKIKEKIRENEELEEREHRIELNRLAFEDWMKNSTQKPIPIPSNQGITSLCSSASVTYINPVPWTHNINEI